jgi:lysophospholipase L1-like esterase
MGFNKSCILSYDFVGGSGTTVVDKLGSGVVGTLKNISSPSTTDSGWVSDGLLLDGVDDYVDFSNTTISPLKEFSVEMVFTWYKNAIGYPSIITSTNFTCYIADAEGGRLYFNGSDGTFATNMIFKPNVKYHFVYTRNANGSKMYVNGKLDVTTTINTLPLDFANFSIAKSANGIKAKFYSFNVYNRSLNDDEVWNRYKESIPEQQYVSNGLVLNLDAEGVSSGTTWNDKSGYGNNATLVGFADPSTSTSGWNKGKLVFDGIDDIVQTNNTYYGTLPLTVEMVATRTSDNTGYLFNIDVPNGVENDGICILYDSANGGMISLLGIGGHATNYKPSLNTPFHLVVTYTSNVVKVYINGKYQSSLSGAYTSITGTTNITIGARYDAGYKFTGSISCVRQYNRTLSDAEILINYNVAMGLPQYVYEGSDYPESLVTLNDIDLSNIKNIKSVNWQPSVNSNDTALAVLSVDSGTTWKSWSGSAWQNVDINNETEMIAKGMTKDVVNAISSANLESLRGTSTKLRFGYYLRTKVLDTVYNNDQFIVTYSDINNSDVTVGQTYNTGTGNTTSFIDATPLNGGLNNYEAVPYDTTNGEGTPITGFILAKPLASELFGVVNYASGTIDYSWSTDNGVNGYKLYITNPDGTTTIRDLTASNYNYSVTQEGMVYAYVTAYIYDEVYGYAESDKSNVVQLETYPINAPSNVTYTFNPDSSSMIIRWTDTNVVEDGFKLNYSIDNATYTEIDIMSTSYSTVGTEYSVEIPLTNINESLKFYIRAYNETGSAINSTSLITLLTKPNYFQVGYVLGYVKYGWIDNTQSEQKYRLFFSIDGGTQQSIDVTSTTVTTEGSIYNVQIAMNTTSTMTSYICAIDSNGRLGIPSAKVDTSFATYHKEPAPSDFKVSWKTVGTAQYTWTCNNQEVIGYKLTYFINEENPTTVDMTCPLNSSAHVMSYEVQLFNDMDKVTAWVQPYTLIDTGLQSDSQSITYIIVNTDAPTNFWKTRTDSGYRFVWDAKNYVDNYEIHYTINQTEYVAHTQYNYYDIQLDPKTTTEFSIYLFANFSTLEVSDHSSTIRFVPVVTKKYAEETKIYTVNQIKGCLDTKISVIRARFVFMDSMNTTNGNIKVIIPRITTKFVQRDASYKAFDAQSTFYSTLTYGKDMMLVKNSTSLINRVNGMTITYGLKRTNGLLTSSLDRNVNRKFSESMWLLNNNVARKSLTSMSISCFNLILAKREIVSVFYTTARSNDALLSTTIWTKLMLEYGLYSEIHKIRICTMGDSITAGHPVYWAETEIDFKPNSGTGNIQSQYQYWLQRRLSDDYEIINNGRGSDTTERMVNRFDRDILPLSPQYCIIQGGTNDITWAVTQNKGDKAYLDNSMEIAKQNILWMVQRCIDNNIVPIIGTLLPRTSISGIYKQALWDFNEWIKAYCNGHEGLYYVDFYNAGKDNIPPTPLEESPVTGNMNPIYDGDSVFDEFGNLVRRGYGIHPNVQGYKLMAEAVPLGIFNALKTGIKVYIDEDCTVEENTDNSDIYHTQYNITFSNIDRGRTKIITRYIKNVGNMPMMYTLYNTSESGVDMTFSLDGVNYTEFVNGLLNNETVNTIYVKIVVPRTGVIPSVQSALSTRSYKVIA